MHFHWGFSVLFLIAISFNADGHDGERPKEGRAADEEVECPDLVVQTNKNILSIQKVESPWVGVPTSKLRFGLRKDGLFLLGFSAKELLDAGVVFQRCKGGEGAFRIVHPESFQSTNVGPAGVFFPEGWKAVTPDQAKFVKENENTLASKIGAPFLVIDPSEFLPGSPAELLKLLGKPDVLANVAAHETFHCYQMRDFAGGATGGLMRYFPDKPERLAQLKDEIQDWKEIRKALDAKDIERVKTLSRGILQRRKSGNTDSLASWEEVRQFERIEGTAHYFAVTVSREAKLKESGDVNFLYTKDFTVENPEIFERGRAFFYPTGALFSEVLKVLSPSVDWQKEIAGGKPPSDVLESALREG